VAHPRFVGPSDLSLSQPHFLLFFHCLQALPFRSRRSHRSASFTNSEPRADLAAAHRSGSMRFRATFVWLDHGPHDNAKQFGPLGRKKKEEIFAGGEKERRKEGRKEEKGKKGKSGRRRERRSGKGPGSCSRTLDASQLCFKILLSSPGARRGCNVNERYGGACQAYNCAAASQLALQSYPAYTDRPTQLLDGKRDQ